MVLNPAESVNRTSTLREPLLLFLVGACLSISQFVMIRDFVTILYGEEVVIILVTAAFFLGLSIGYFLSLKFSDKFFHNSFLVIVFLHLTFLVPEVLMVHRSCQSILASTSSQRVAFCLYSSIPLSI